MHEVPAKGKEPSADGAAADDGPQMTVGVHRGTVAEGHHDASEKRVPRASLGHYAQICFKPRVVRVNSHPRGREFT